MADRNQMARDCWKKASEALSSESYDYAVEMFFRAMLLAPDNLVFRQSLRGAMRKMYGDNGSGARMASMKLMGTRTKLKKQRMTKDWKAMDQTAEEGMKVNPWDAALNAAVGEACANLGYQDVALFGYEMAIRAEPNNKDYNRQYARLQEEKGNYTEAIGAWSRVAKLDPNDEEARSKMTQLQASMMMHKSGYEDAKSTTDVKKTAYDDYRRQGTRPQPGQQPDGPGASPEADLQRAIRKDPSDKNNYLKLADLYKRDNKLDEAVEMLQKGLEVSGGDASVREQLEDVQLDQLRNNLELAKEAADQGDETAQKNAGALARELLQREIEIFSRRVERYPRDARLKFELAKRHMRNTEFTKAIPLLQEAVVDNRLEAEVLVTLGECFQYDKKPALALRQYEKAKDLITFSEQPEHFKRVHYFLGRLYEEADKRDLAEHHYTEVIGVDYNYRDTVKRLEDLQTGA